MTKITLLAVFAASVLFTGCGEDTKKESIREVKKVEKKIEKVKEKVEQKISSEIVGEAPGDTGQKLYTKCAGCHGKDGKTKALGKSEIIAGQGATELAKKLEEYKAGKRDVAGMGKLMSGQLATLNQADLLALADYISKL